LLTSCYPQRWGHEFNPGGDEQQAPWFGVPEDRPLLVDAFKRSGYATALIGKWHLGGVDKFHPLNRGFTHFYGFLEGLSNYIKRVPTTQLYRMREKVKDEGYMTDLLANEAVEFIKTNKNNPFFIYLPFNASMKNIEWMPLC
jgi:arylsulfatase A-like enzyme